MIKLNNTGNWFENQEKKLILEKISAEKILQRSMELKENLSKLRFGKKEAKYFKEKNK